MTAGADPGDGTIDLAFTAREEWTDPAGNVLGGGVVALPRSSVPTPSRRV